MKRFTFVLLLISGCMAPVHVQRDFWLGSAPGGYENVTIYDRGSLAQGLQARAVFGWHRQRVEEWISFRAPQYGGADKLRRMAQSLYWILVDDWRVNVSEEARSPVYAPGYTDRKSFIIATIYERGGPSCIEPDLPPWRKRLNPADGKWYSAVLRPGRELVSVKRELDRMIGIDDGE